MRLLITVILLFKWGKQTSAVGSPLPRICMSHLQKRCRQITTHGSAGRASAWYAKWDYYCWEDPIQNPYCQYCPMRGGMYFWIMCSRFRPQNMQKA